MPFAKGRSGNPGGRPKGSAEVRALARAMTGRAFEEIERMAFTGSDDRVKLEAIKIILDRGYGKAPQPMDGDGEGRPIEFTRIERVIINPRDLRDANF